MPNGSRVASVPLARPALAEVVAVQRAGDDAGAAAQAEVGLQPLHQPGAAGPDADDDAVVAELAPHRLAQPLIQRLCIRRVDFGWLRRVGRGLRFGLHRCSRQNCSRRITAAAASASFAPAASASVVL